MKMLVAVDAASLFRTELLAAFGAFRFECVFSLSSIVEHQYTLLTRILAILQ